MIVVNLENQVPGADRESLGSPEPRERPRQRPSQSRRRRSRKGKPLPKKLPLQRRSLLAADVVQNRLSLTWWSLLRQRRSNWRKVSRFQSMLLLMMGRARRWRRPLLVVTDRLPRVGQPCGILWRRLLHRLRHAMWQALPRRRPEHSQSQFQKTRFNQFPIPKNQKGRFLICFIPVSSALQGPLLEICNEEVDRRRDWLHVPGAEAAWQAGAWCCHAFCRTCDPRRWEPIVKLPWVGFSFYFVGCGAFRLDWRTPLSVSNPFPAGVAQSISTMCLLWHGLRLQRGWKKCRRFWWVSRKSKEHIDKIWEKESAWIQSNSLLLDGCPSPNTRLPPANLAGAWRCCWWQACRKDAPGLPGTGSWMAQLAWFVPSLSTLPSYQVQCPVAQHFNQFKLWTSLACSVLELFGLS